MLLHNSPLYNVYFGDKRDHLFPPFTITQPLIEMAPFLHLKKAMLVDNLVFLHQVHGVNGLTITSPEQASRVQPFSIDGDYLITNAPRVGIGILTADCLPIIMYDSFQHVIAIVHAGWRGSVDGIGLKVVAHMQAAFETKLEHLRIFFGPSAKVCCYQVKEEFLSNLEQHTYTDQVIHRHGKEFYFDLALFNRLILEDAGIKRDAFQLQYNKCTIEDDSLYSYRREGKDAGRQMTVVCLK
jgi:YfiH family protein